MHLISPGNVDGAQNLSASGLVLPGCLPQRTAFKKAYSHACALVQLLAGVGLPELCLRSLLENRIYLILNNSFSAVLKDAPNANTRQARHARCNVKHQKETSCGPRGI